MTMLPIRPLVAVVAAVCVAVLPALPAQAVRRAAVPVLVDVRAAHQSGLDRLVFEFRGPLPARRDVRYVSRLIADGSGEPVAVAGDAVLQISFDRADGHDRDGRATYGPARRTYALPGLVQVVNTGDFEATLTFGAGLARRVPFRVRTLTRPSRVVVDLITSYRTVPARAYFLDTAGRGPRTAAVTRPVIPPATAAGALLRLFAGPTQADRGRGLRFAASKATGFSKLTVADGIARVYLTGPVSGGGSAFTVADQIRPTLKQFPAIRWVKIYDAAGRTGQPAGPSDSVPPSLERRP
ncbi:hypothetical protein DMB42_28880 [Nonomuraea sp. WAC 01424]|uniref:GerMN domain-containing protein n=1 Tax=Nonomuraea sp. WAC 01424 TaxID=2203200 RepID=UPI000F7B17FA|nr:GerMN domain-containing protein [Nonomuraea sp. WAC 01424]RSN04817.1 hypothetical protein DMB42_28880 [Nonomuraea sp. WAC 01424]